MQILNSQLRMQQCVLTLLNFYRAPIDGLWGPESIQAKKRFEQDASFSPAIPSHGMPFSDKGPFPKRVYMTREGLTVSGREEEIKELYLKSNKSQSQEPTTSQDTPNETVILDKKKK
jgi:hypothetical protein